MRHVDGERLSFLEKFRTTIPDVWIGTVIGSDILIRAFDLFRVEGNPTVCRMIRVLILIQVHKTVIALVFGSFNLFLPPFAMSAVLILQPLQRNIPDTLRVTDIQIHIVYLLLIRSASEFHPLVSLSLSAEM